MDSLVVRNSPESSATSVDVPPMSNVITLSIPASSAAYAAPVTPPAGPDNIVVIGARAAFSAEMIPPLDCITCTRTLAALRGVFLADQTARMCSWAPLRYRLITGARYALITVVEVRSYSRNSGRISCETDTKYPWRLSAAATRFS